jgi:hypothetical protein
MAHWVKTRLTGVMTRCSDGKRMRFLLGERDDGGVFWVEVPWNSSEKPLQDIAVQVAYWRLNDFLDEPLLERSIGTFDNEPNFYTVGMSPARV